MGFEPSTVQVPLWVSYVWYKTLSAVNWGPIWCKHNLKYYSQLRGQANGVIQTEKYPWLPLEWTFLLIMIG